MLQEALEAPDRQRYAEKDLRIAAGLTTNVIAKLGKNQNVSTEVLGKICKVLNCEITDIMEFIDDDPSQTNEKEVRT